MVLNILLIFSVFWAKVLIVDRCEPYKCSRLLIYVLSICKHCCIECEQVELNIIYYFIRQMGEFSFWVSFRPLKWLFLVTMLYYTPHSMARANLNKSKFFLTSNTTVSKYYIPKRPRICTLSDPNLLSKSTSKCEHCETRFT